MIPAERLVKKIATKIKSINYADLQKNSNNVQHMYIHIGVTDEIMMPGISVELHMWRAMEAFTNLR